MANDQRLADISQRPPAAAPRSAIAKDIPKIVLNEKKEAEVPPETRNAECDKKAHETLQTNEHINSQPTTRLVASLPKRSSSDVGLPAASMPNLALSQTGGGDATASENYLEVFCSPRTFRRSVDLDVSSKDHSRGQYEWMESLDSSSNCLKVLTSSSRVGSSLSLNSECTARSIGLLSNDSDSDNDLSLSEAENSSVKPPQLRRFMSYPEESSSPELCSSQSLINLKTSECKTDIHSTPLASATSETVSSEEEKLDFDKISLQHAKPIKMSGRDFVPCASLDETSTSPGKRVQRQDFSRDLIGSSRRSHMLSYKCDINDSSRDVRIRQWLQDMNTNTQ